MRASTLTPRRLTHASACPSPGAPRLGTRPPGASRSNDDLGALHPALTVPRGGSLPPADPVGAAHGTPSFADGGRLHGIPGQAATLPPPCPKSGLLVGAGHQKGRLLTPRPQEQPGQQSREQESSPLLPPAASGTAGFRQPLLRGPWCPNFVLTAAHCLNSMVCASA